MKKYSNYISVFQQSHFAQKPILQLHKIKSTTVYSNSAELLQSASVTLPSGTSEIVIKMWPDYVNETPFKLVLRLMLQFYPFSLHEILFRNI